MNGLTPPSAPKSNPPSDEPCPIVADRYECTRVLGQGAFCRVFEAFDRVRGCTVAVKLLLPHRARDERSRGRLLQEAEALQRLSSPFAVSALQSGEDPIAGPYLVMESIDGPTLTRFRTLIADGTGRIPSPVAARICGQVAEALAAAHECGLVHRDVKPDNVIVVDPDPLRPAVKLIDFGLVCTAGGAEDPDGPPRAPAGTPSYMSPEQCQGQAVGPASDLYSLGAMLYELLVGQPPFTAGTVEALFVAHAGETLVPPKAAGGARMSSNLESLVRSLLSKDPDRRPRSAAEVSRALFRISVAAVPRSTPWWRRGRTRTARGEAGVATSSRVDRTRLYVAIGVSLALATAIVLWILLDAGGGLQ